MKYLWFMVVSCLMGAIAQAATPSHATPQLDAGLVNPGAIDKPAWFKESFLDIRDDIREATAANKRVLLYFYQDGCPYCTKLVQENFQVPSIVEKTQKHFDVIAINMWGDRNVTDLKGIETTEKKFSIELKVQYTPTILFLNEVGDIALRVNGYYAPEKFEAALDFVAGQHEKNMRFNAYYTQRQVVNTSKTYQLPNTLASPLRLQARTDSNRPLLVIFAQPHCETCDELFNDILKRKELVYSLTHLDVALANTDDNTAIQTPDGKEMKLSEWAKALAINYSPSLVFFDPMGKEVFRTEAYFKAFHIHGAMDYVVSGAYQWMPEFQRYLQHRREVLIAHGLPTDLLQ